MIWVVYKVEPGKNVSNETIAEMWNKSITSGRQLQSCNKQKVTFLITKVHTELELGELGIAVCGALDPFRLMGLAVQRLAFFRALV